MSVDCIIEDRRWAEANIVQMAVAAYQGTMRHLGYDPDQFEIGLLACDDDKIAELNTQFRDKPKPTNVLSWPSEERGADADGAKPEPVIQMMQGDTFLGDVAISFDTCRREAEESDKTLKSHATHLLVHGTLHLLGYDHERDGDAALMEGLETQILANMGIADPYAQ